MVAELAMTPCEFVGVCGGMAVAYGRVVGGGQTQRVVRVCGVVLMCVLWPSVSACLIFCVHPRADGSTAAVRRGAFF